MVPPGGAGIGMHVIPVEKAIETEQEAIGLEKISYWLHKYEGKYAKSMCSCRASRDKLGEGCGDDVENWCIAVGDMADYVVQTQRGEYITYDEAMAIFKQAEGQRLRPPDHQHRRRAEDLWYLQLQRQRVQRPADQPDVQHTQYVPQCLCGRGGDGEVRGLWPLCGELSAGAVKLGQKLCTKDGYIEYPRSRAARRGEVGAGEVEHRLSGLQPHQLLRHRHRTLQDRLPRPHRRAGLSEAGGTGQVPGGFAAHQAGEPISCRVRPHLQPPVRGCLHPRHRGRGRGHRRGKALYRPAGIWTRKRALSRRRSFPRWTANSAKKSPSSVEAPPA